MGLQVTERAQIFLKDNLLDKKLYLDFIDGDSPGYEGAISCALGISFRLLLVKEPADYPVLAKFDETLTSSIGEIKIKSSSNMYLEAEMTLDFNPTYHRLQLSGKSGMITDNVAVEEL